MKIGIVGLPYVGKTSVFNALTQSEAETGTYSAQKKSNIGSVKVPDKRLDALAPIFHPKKVTPTSIDYVDVAGVSKGDVERSGLETSVIAELREVDALAHVVRLFEDDAVPHVDGSINAQRDIETIDLELAFADLQVIEKRLERLGKEIKLKKAPILEEEYSLLTQCKAALEADTPLRALALSPEDEKMIKGYRFLTQKPMVIVLNIGEDQLEQSEEICQRFAEYAEKIVPVGQLSLRKPQTDLIALSARLEMEIAQLDAADAEPFLAEMGLKETALTRVIHKSYRLLGLITFLTGGPNEVKAWTLKEGMTALDAAGIIHTDFARGFIRAETIQWSDLAACGSLARAREKGLLRLEGKDYVVKDGDVLTIRFSV
jgi:hypothetical protein